MEQVICMNGHFYDGDKYRECPHCASGMKPATPSVFVVARDAPQAGIGKPEETTSGRLKKMLFGGRTGGKEKNVRGNPNEERASQGRQAVQRSAENSFPVTEMVIEQENHENFYPETEVVMVQNDTVSPYRKTEFVSQERDHVEYMAEEASTGKNIDPPVGYLICIEGADFGIGFLLKLGSNSIGRSASMDVTLTDPKVSGGQQACVLYDPYNREFFLKPEKGAGSCYLNDEAVLEPKALKSHDMIVLGATKLMLIPVCDARFDW